MSVESPFVVRAATLEARADAQAILQRAEDAACGIRAAAEAARISALEEARREGLRQGLAEAAAMAASAAEAVQMFWRERGSELRDVALAVAHRILSSLPTDELIARLASEAIAEHARDSRLEIRAAPEVAEILREALRDRLAGGSLTITADAGLPRDACALLHPRGRSEIGLLAQFRSLVTPLAASGEGSPQEGRPH